MVAPGKLYAPPDVGATWKVPVAVPLPETEVGTMQ